MSRYAKNDMATTGPLSEPKLSAEAVANYLSHNPTFFHVFPNLLDDLSIPHPKSGQAVSLLERQVHQLREQKETLQLEVDHLLDVAGENGQLFYKVKQFTKALMAAQSEQDFVDAVYAQMHDLFRVDQVTLVSWEMPKQGLAGLHQLGVSQHWSDSLKVSLLPGKPVCGLLEDTWQKGLFATNQAMHSLCLLPLGSERVWGVLALGSKDDRFNPELGTYFLKVMAELITVRLEPLFTKTTLD